MKRLLLTLCTLLAALSYATAQESYNVYEDLNLDYAGLESVKAAYKGGNMEEANRALLAYFQSRKPINIYEFDMENIKLSELEQRQADESLEHKFYAHKGYQPSYFYGDDINWQYWPIKDNELRWQLHRHYWFIPLAKAYHLTGDEKYAKAWIEHYSDWVAKNPLVEADVKSKRKTTSAGEVDPLAENSAFAWRPLETSRRTQDQLMVFALMIKSPNFSAEYLNMFLDMYHRHASYTHTHYSAHGNHLLFEAQRMLFASIYFPEFKDSAAWRKSAVEILCREIDKQVYDDGIHYELSYGYHIAVVNIFLKAYGMAQINGIDDAFPSSYVATIESMLKFVYDTMTPDYGTTMYGDTKLYKKSEMLKQYKRWSEVFPKNSALRWFATQGEMGKRPAYLSSAFPTGGFYTLRNGWGSKSTVAIVKAGPPAFWHDQPDIGSFHFWKKGREFFPDSGCYVYGGDAEVMQQRDWFRQTAVHNTVTLDGKNFETTDAKQLVWSDEENLTTLVYENASYADYLHRRSFFLVQGEVLVIVDEVTGAAKGKVGVNFQLAPGELRIGKNNHMVKTMFEDGNNIYVRTFSPSKIQLVEKEGMVSYAYRQKEPRPAYSIEAEKGANEDMIFVSVVVPGAKKYRGEIKADIKESKFDDRMNITLTIGEEGLNVFDLGYKLK